MAAYFIGDVEVLDRGGYDEYATRFDATLAEFGGRILVVGGNPEPIEGDWRPGRLVVLEFPSVERAKAWYASPAYQEILPIRLRHGQTHYVTLFESWDG